MLLQIATAVLRWLCEYLFTHYLSVLTAIFQVDLG